MENFWGIFAGFGSLLILLVAWSAIWKGLALWKSARNNHLGWFIALMIINTAGILEILYIYVFSKNNNQAKPATDTTTPPQI